MHSITEMTVAQARALRFVLMDIDNTLTTYDKEGGAGFAEIAATLLSPRSTTGAQRGKTL